MSVFRIINNSKDLIVQLQLKVQWSIGGESQCVAILEISMSMLMSITERRTSMSTFMMPNITSILINAATIIEE